MSLPGRGGRKGALEVCPSCRGTGVQMRLHQLGFGMVQQVSTMCGSCQGQGQRMSHRDRCKTCVGRKINRQKKILEVHIDKGWRGFFLSVRTISNVHIRRILIRLIDMLWCFQYLYIFLKNMVVSFGLSCTTYSMCFRALKHMFRRTWKTCLCYIVLSSCVQEWKMDRR